MKKLLLFICLLICCRDAMAQKIVERKNKIIESVTERFQSVIEADKQIKQGTYQAFFDKKTIVASGKYVNDKKVGIWHYFDRKGTLMQNYDYDQNKLLYEAPEGKNSPFRYAVEDTIKDNDKATQPVRLGGRYFGYAPYVRLFKLPNEFYQQGNHRYMVTLEILISPMGRVANLIARVKYSSYDNDETTYNLNIDLLSPDDRVFIPATFNKQPIASQIHFTYFMDVYGTVDLY